MSARYIQPGKAINITAAGNIAANDVVVFGGIVGVAHDPITSGGTGAIQIEGVYEMPKESGLAISGGAAVNWDTTSGYVTTSSGGVACGKTVAPAEASATVVLVKLNA